MASLVLSLCCALAYAVPALAAQRMGDQAKRGWVIGAWLLHALVLLAGLTGFGMVGDAGTQARFGFAAALSGTVYLAAAVYGAEMYLYPQLKTHWSLATLGALAVLVALAFPGRVIHASQSPWLPMHWALGIASYGLFGVAAVHAWFLIRAEERMRQGLDAQNGMPLLTMERLTFRFVGAGFVLLTATLLAGWLFGETLYGAGVRGKWKWDHKTMFSVLSWFTFAALLVGRARFGWRGRSAVRLLYVGSALLLFAYVGSRFVLEVILRRAS